MWENKTNEQPSLIIRYHKKQKKTKTINHIRHDLNWMYIDFIKSTIHKCGIEEVYK